MPWSFANLAIQILGGMIGGHIAAALAKEKKFGFLVQTLLGAVGGGLSGCFLQTFAITVVSGNGSLNEVRLVEQIMLEAITGIAAGGIATLAAIILKHGNGDH
jgi:uncharacterized membrane protein YeaQ/YmgE (transglycosylase-associated protein family)